MKPSSKSSLLIVLAAAVVAACPSTALAQLSDLPLKPGLWETHVNVKAGTMNNEVAGKACFSAGTNLGDYLTASNRGTGVKCSISNKVQSSHAISYDTACTGPETGSKGHTDLQMNGTDSFSGTTHTTVTGAARGKPINMVIDKTFSAKFLSTACGDVEPMVTGAK